MRHIGDDERRARIAQRHGIAPDRRCAGLVAATEAMTVLHATEPATVYLSLAARTEGLRPEDVTAALVDDRVLVKQLAMRRTLFVFPRDLLPAAWGGPSARVADQEGAKLRRDAVATGLADDGDAWLADATDAVLGRFAGGDVLTVREIRAQVPQVAGTMLVAPNSRWGGELPIAPRVLTYLGARALLARGPNAGHWRVSRPTWTAMPSWLGDDVRPMPAEEGYAELVRRWLWTFGPGTEADIAWWLGATLGIVRRALAAVGAVAVGLDRGATGWVLPADLEPVPAGPPWAALLPVLDATTMGWKQRDFYLGPHGPQLFDSVGNGGTTAWWNGRIVGCWVQDPGGTVRVVLVEDVPSEARDALDAEAERLTAWLDGVTISTVYSAAAMRAARAG
jgi:hypothetical protein